MPRKLRIKTLTSLLIAAALISVFQLRSYAAPDADTKVSELFGSILPMVGQSGTLTVNGPVTVNGNSVQTGATLLSGSIIATGDGGNVIIDLGPLGRIEVRENTSIQLTITSDSVQVKTLCDEAEIKVNRGQVEERTPKTQTIKAGESQEVGNGAELTATGGADFIVECDEDEGAGVVDFVGPGLLGLLLLIGAGTAVAAGIALGDEEGGGVNPGQISPARP